MSESLTTIEDINIKIDELNGVISTLNASLKNKEYLTSEAVEGLNQSLSSTVEYKGLLEERKEIMVRESNETGQTLTSKIEEYCKLTNITISALEKAVGFGNGTIRRWSSSLPSIEKVLKIADYFDVSLDSLLERNPSNKEIWIDRILDDLDINLRFKVTSIKDADGEVIESLYMAPSERKLIQQIIRNLDMPEDGFYTVRDKFDK